jgi:hypothetical protein
MVVCTCDSPLVKAIRRLLCSLSLCLVASCGGGASESFSSSEPQTQKIRLPIEVIGPDGYIEQVAFKVNDASSIDKLYIQANRLGYRDSSANRNRGPKGSIRINAGAWIDLSDSSPQVSVSEPERSYGGIAGGYQTVRLRIPVNNIVNGENTVEFRFNRSDGISVGYRVIDFNLLRGADKVLAESSFVAEDPTRWRPELDNAADIEEGRRLWTSAALFDPLLNARIKATCGSCHAHDGRDLKYFNFSNWSIQVRSQFHGLTQLQGKQISSYIRSLDAPAPAQARPWHPPYQPGPGLDAKPVEEWSAGAGLAAVLESDLEMLGHLFPNGTGRAEMERVMSSKGNLNLRELPIALQLPDWNEWLPTVHPVDIWDNFESEEANQGYLQGREQLQATGVNELIERGQLHHAVGGIHKAIVAFWTRGTTQNAGATWRVSASANISKIKGVSRERARSQLAQWQAVKQWEVMQEFKLEGLGKRIFGDNNEERVWPSPEFSVFQVAPHITADNIKHFIGGQSVINGKYASTAWYQLQLTLNSASRQKVHVFPVDWPYHYIHIWQTSALSGLQHPLRYTASHIKSFQMRDNGVGPDYLGFQLRNSMPWQFYSDDCGNEAFMGALDAHQPHLRRTITEALLATWLKKMKQPEMSLATWPRAPSDGAGYRHFRWYQLETAAYVPVPEPATRGPCDSSAEGPVNVLFDITTLKNADGMLRVIPRLRNLGVDPALISELVAWSKAAWPAGRWE